MEKKSTLASHTSWDEHLTVHKGKKQGEGCADGEKYFRYKKYSFSWKKKTVDNLEGSDDLGWERDIVWEDNAMVSFMCC